ncbi:hypothetical protein GIB67_020055 [Kingdonia uniflora]|uniref:Branched-chain-amino-acid aminotransferase n=1 Tax=Kingdonia uniflora TaxID=39325 RepID=A0A7J7L295_9MAGN|nr:hypothetical protein GIB67_020055 [Kingdonia uniflora]
MINSTLSKEILSHVVGLETSLEVWKALGSTLAQHSKARELQLKHALQECKKGNSTIDDYLRTFKNICDSLGAIGCSVTDEDKSYWLPQGLGPNYESFTTTMLAKPLIPSYQEVMASLKIRNLRTSSLHKSPMESAYICGRANHTAIQCYKRFDHAFQSDEIPEALASMTIGDPHERAWYSDSGATSHMTNNEGNFSKLQSYSVTDKDLNPLALSIPSPSFSSNFGDESSRNTDASNNPDHPSDEIQGGMPHSNSTQSLNLSPNVPPVHQPCVSITPLSSPPSPPPPPPRSQEVLAYRSGGNAIRTEEDYADVNWDEIGFGLMPTDYMYVMKCSQDEKFSCGELNRYGNIELSPSSGVLNYGQGLFEGMKAYRKVDGGLLLFRPEENAQRLKFGAERMCMPSPSTEQFINAVKQTVVANKRWVPPPGKGSLYIRPLLIGTGAILGLAPAPNYTFLIYASPVGNYFKEGLAPLNLVIEDEFHRAIPGGTGGIKTIANYAPVLKAQTRAKSNGFSDVLYLDSVKKKYLEEVSSCNVFVVKGNVISTPSTEGTILSGITRKSIIDLARNYGYQVEERPIPVTELTHADEVFCTGTAVIVAPVGSITYQGKRFEYKTGLGAVSQKLYSTLTAIQTGLIKDKMGWTVEID